MCTALAAASVLCFQQVVLLCGRAWLELACHLFSKLAGCALVWPPCLSRLATCPLGETVCCCSGLLAEPHNILRYERPLCFVVAVPSQLAPNPPKIHGSGTLAGTGEYGLVVCSLEPPLAQVTLITLVETLLLTLASTILRVSPNLSLRPPTSPLGPTPCL